MRQDALITLAVLASRPELHSELSEHILHLKRDRSATWSECYECALQTYLFAGFPAALEAARALHRAWPEDESLPWEAEMLEAFSTHEQNLERGEELYRQVYAANANVVREALQTLSPELALWAVTEGYGKTLSRPGLDIVTRELAIVGMLTQLGWERQLFSHIMGARNVGASLEQIQKAIQLGARADEGKLNKALALFDRAH